MDEAKGGLISAVNDLNQLNSPCEISGDFGLGILGEGKMSKIFLAKNYEGKVYALRENKVVGIVFRNTDPRIDLSEDDFDRVYEGWADVIHLSNNPPNPFYTRPGEIFSNWDLPLGIRSNVSVAISSNKNDLLPYKYNEQFRG